eukprot:1193645-Prorocentrum_minimum.AAC.3
METPMFEVVVVFPTPPFPDVTTITRGFVGGGIASSSSSAAARTTHPFLPRCTLSLAIPDLAAVPLSLNVTLVGVLGLSRIAPARGADELALVRGDTTVRVQRWDACIASIFPCGSGERSSRPYAFLGGPASQGKLQTVERKSGSRNPIFLRRFLKLSPSSRFPLNDQFRSNRSTCGNHRTVEIVCKSSDERKTNGVLTSLNELTSSCVCASHHVYVQLSLSLRKSVLLMQVC